VCNADYCDDFPPVGALQSGQIAIYTSSKSGKRFERTNATFQPFKDSHIRIWVEGKDGLGTFNLPIELDPTQAYQRILGFGGAFTDSAGINLNRLSTPARKNLIESYFGDAGIGYTTGRVPMASCDMGTRAYSYCDTEGDLELNTFSLTEEDLTLKIPYIKWAQNLTEDNLRLFATPWSAPGWMKDTGKMVGGGELKGDFNGQYYQTWAKYYSKFFEKYADNGVNFWGLTVQNEPSTGAELNYGWQAMYLSAAMQRDFVKDLLGPELKNSPLTRELKIMINDDQRFMLPESADEIFADQQAASFIDGIGVHWYEDFLFSADILNTTHNRHPDKFILPSEASSGWFLFHGPEMGDWSRGEAYGQDIMTDLQTWAVGWTDWNLCLNEQGGPTFVGNYLDASIIVNSTTDEFYKQPQFYFLGHFSKLIVPYSQRIGLNIQGNSKNLLLDATAYQTPSDQYVVVLQNRHQTKTYKLVLINPSNNNQAADISIENNSIVTLTWQK
jgi:glucosylceramidase